MSSDSHARATVSPTRHATGILSTVALLALLYFGREVLVPVVLALFLGSLLSPWVRFNLRLGLGHGVSVLLVVLATLVITVGIAAVVASQAAHLARSLPQYQATIHAKTQTLRHLTLDRFEAVRGEFGKVIEQPATPPPPAGGVSAATPNRMVTPSSGPAPASDSSVAVLTRLLSAAWIPLQTAGIVLAVLVFVLLEQESLRDRFIRLAGGTDLRATTTAINDAAARLSRFFLSTFSVNVGVGVTIWLGLSLIGLPNAPLWGALVAILRFVPYVGVWLVAALTVLFAAAVGPGWSLVLMTTGLFFIVELIVSQVVEPLLYGHTTGLSPLAVVVAAIFWSWLWGPVGLVMSTPLTLCLVVAGRYVKGLDPLTILLGDAPALTMPQRLYQRALSGDAREILEEARRYLKRKTFATYCDAIVLPALQFGRIDLLRGVIQPEQQTALRDTIITVIETLSGEGRTRSGRKRRSDVLNDASIGRQLRQHRADAHGRWQGPLAVPAGSIVLCVGMGTAYDDLVTELLTRVLRGLHVDARHLIAEDFEKFDAEPHPDLTPGAVAVIYVVSAEPAVQQERVDSFTTMLRHREPGARIIVMRLTDPLTALALELPVGPDVDGVTSSLEEAAKYAMPQPRENGTGAMA